jgi:hypothetical protein
MTDATTSTGARRETRAGTVRALILPALILGLFLLIL